MTYQRIRHILTTLSFLLCIPPAVTAQGAPPADAYFLHFSLDSRRLPTLCLQIDSATVAPYCYGVDYDASGRPEKITRLFFGNLNTREPWTIMKFRYDTLQSGSIAVHRTWHNPSGMPVQIGVAYGEAALYDSTGFLVMYTLIDEKGDRVERVNAVTRSMFRPNEEGNILQEWRYSNNKQYYGSEEDIWNSQFAPLDRQAWFRRFRTDGQGHVIEEYPLDLARRPVTFPDGVYGKHYKRNACGRPVSVTYYNQEGQPMTDSSGVGRIEYDYDTSGRLTEWRATDHQGNPVGRNEHQGAARMVRLYREFDGKLLSEIFFDAEGNELELSAEPDS